MAGHIKATIIKINLDPPYCLVSIFDNDNDVVLVSPSNIGLNLNPDGTANTVWIEETLKALAIDRRAGFLTEQAAKKLITTINESED